MAKIVQGILGGFSGRVGTVVGYHRRGQWFVRAYQPHIRDRKSDAQLQQRSRFKAMIQFASQATAVLRVGLREGARVQSLTEGNLFLRLNHSSFSGQAGSASRTSPAADFPSLRFSQGTYAPPRGLQYAVDERGVLRVQWGADGGRLADRIHIFIYCSAMLQGVSLVSERGARGTQALLPEGFASGELHLWAFAEGAQGEVSQTQYGARTFPDVNPLKNSVASASPSGEGRCEAAEGRTRAVALTARQGGDCRSGVPRGRGLFSTDG